MERLRVCWRNDTTSVATAFMNLALRIIIGLGFTGAVGLHGALPHRPGDVVLKPWTLRTAAGDKVECEYGTLYVPENRSNPASRTIGIGFLRIKAEQAANRPPTIHLPGGPANSYLLNLNANKSDAAARIMPSGYA